MTQAAPETTAPTVQGQAGQVSGTIHAPTPALNETAGDVLRGVLDNRVFMLEDQDLIQVGCGSCCKVSLVTDARYELGVSPFFFRWPAIL